VDPPQGFAPDEALKPLDAQGELAEREGTLAADRRKHETRRARRIGVRETGGTSRTSSAYQDGHQHAGRRDQ
jgi:hypothetical protein